MNLTLQELGSAFGTVFPEAFWLPNKSVHTTAKEQSETQPLPACPSSARLCWSVSAHSHVRQGWEQITVFIWQPYHNVLSLAENDSWALRWLFQLFIVAKPTLKYTWTMDSSEKLIFLVPCPVTLLATIAFIIFTLSQRWCAQLRTGQHNRRILGG